MAGFNSTGRFPLIALSYANKNKAVGGELIVDYDNKRLYLADRFDPSILVDFGQSIFDQLEKIDGSKIWITLDGVETKLIDLLQQFKDNYITVQDVANVLYLTKDPNLDNVSLKLSKMNQTEVAGFYAAPDGTVPKKMNGTISWVTPVDLYGGINTGSGTSGEESGNNGYDNIDISYKIVVPIEPINNKLNLVVSKALISKNITGNNFVVLPKIIIDYEEIEWLVVTSTGALTFTFSDNVLFEYVNANQPKPSATQLYTFKTFDGGATWVATVKYFGFMKVSDTLDEIATKEYIEEHYYSKDSIDNEFYNKTDIDNALVWKDEPEV